MNSVATPASGYPSLLEVMQKVAQELEWRDPKGLRHPLENVLFFYLVGQIMGFLSFRSISNNFKYEVYQNLFSKYLDMKHGIPSPASFSRTFAHINTALLLPDFCDWILQLLPDHPDGRPHLAIDGKAMRASINKATKGTSLYIVNVFNVSVNILVYMIRVGAKTNEAATIEKDIASIIYGQKCIVTMDAMGTHSAILQQIVDGGSDYAAPVKSNQKNLMQALDQFITDTIIQHSDIVSNYVDLNGYEESDVPSMIIRDTRCRILDEDNETAGDYAGLVTDNLDNGAPDESDIKGTLDSGDSETTNAHSLEADHSHMQTAAGSTIEGAVDCRADQKVPLQLFDNIFGYKTTGEALPLNPNNRTLVYFQTGTRMIPMVAEHGRYERREYQCIQLTSEQKAELFKDLDVDEWRSVHTVCFCTRYRATLRRDKGSKSNYWELTITRTPYIFSEHLDARECGTTIRNHWAVEQFHNSLDNVFREDKCTVRKEYGPQNVSFFKKLAFDILEKYKKTLNQSQSMSLEDVQKSFAATGADTMLKLIVAPLN